MISFFRHVLAMPFRHIASRKAAQHAADNKLPLAQIQQALRETISDCTDVRSHRAGYKIDQAKTPADLWALRGELHQCIARLHGERVAAARVNDMAALFTGWLPSSQLTRIQMGFRASEK